ncbi:MAG: endolytic transglycosylase MltG [Marvinbryantia sp.]|jgi:UPF0755 protein
MTIRKLLINSLLLLCKALAVIVIVIGIYRFGGYAYEFGHSLYDNEAMSDPPGKDVAIVVPEGASVKNVALLLESKGLIKDNLVFCVQERLSKYHGQMQAGNYVLNTSQYAEQMLAILSGNEEDIRTQGEEE